MNTETIFRIVWILSTFGVVAWTQRWYEEKALKIMVCAFVYMIWLVIPLFTFYWLFGHGPVDFLLVE